MHQRHSIAGKEIYRMQTPNEWRKKVLTWRRKGGRECRSLWGDSTLERRLLCTSTGVARSKVDTLFVDIKLNLLNRQGELHLQLGMGALFQGLCYV